VVYDRLRPGSVAGSLLFVESERDGVGGALN